MKLILASILLSATVANALPESFVKAIHQVETSGRVGPIVSDGGKSLGPLQIHLNCWKDSGIKGNYAQCADLNYSVKVFIAYCNRYEPQAVKNRDYESLARLWNSGPNWRKKKHLTNKYWQRVRSNM